MNEIHKVNKLEVQKFFVQNDFREEYLIDKNDVKTYYIENEYDSQIKFVELEITSFGIPFTTFFDTLSKDRENDESINLKLYELKKIWRK